MSYPGVSSVAKKLEELSIEVKELRTAKPHQGVTTAAEWVCKLRGANELYYSSKLDAWLLDKKLECWICGGIVGADYFPSEECLESGEGGTQEFVWRLLEKISSSDGCKTYQPRKDERGYLSRPGSNLRLSCYPVPDSHKNASFGSRKPDNVFRSRPDATGVHTIVVIGDNKRRARGKFTEEEIGHILDMTRQLLMEYQKRRVLMYCFLTDGFRFQFFSVQRKTAREFIFHESIVYEGLTGWQVCGPNT